tara:strand:+ start:156 stop:575 length:420 start_codon:yes stop_codon:yes gene_type:complete
MTTKMSLKVTVQGPLKHPKTNLRKGVAEGLAVIGDAMVKDVKRQLYQGHGEDTGHLKSKIQWRKDDKFKKQRIVVDSSKDHPKRNVPYTRWVEEGGRHPRWGTPTRFRGYHMFRKTATKFGQQKRVEKMMLVGIRKKMN